MNKFYLLIIFSLCFVNNTTIAQEFINGELSGSIDGLSALPTNWQSVPSDDINCIASGNELATPDLTSLTEPKPTYGIIGNPYSGETFLSGEYSDNFIDKFQEGIMQTVSGFIPGNTYPINFYQSVVKTISLLEKAGSWAVYIDNTLAGITLPTYSLAPFNSTSFIWEFRSIPFVASSVSHTIKFLPIYNYSFSTSPMDVGLRMGIDCIYISTPCDSVNKNTGIPENDFSNQLYIYPNPASSTLNIQTQSNQATLIDLTGKTLLITKLKNGEAQLDVSSLNNGIYFLQTDKGKTQKIIVQH